MSTTNPFQRKVPRQHDHALSILEAEFPPGTPVRVSERVERRGVPSYETQVVGVVEAWDELPSGSWYAHGKNDRLWLPRLKLRKVDGEQSLIVINGGTRIARLEPAKQDA